MTPLFLLSRLKLWRCAKVGARVQVLGSVFVVGGGRVELGDDVVLDGREVPVELHAEPGAVLIIDHGCVLESGVSIEAQQRVEVGPGCRLRAFSKVMDNNFHPVSGSRHQRPASRPVKLEAAVDVGERAIVLPGAWLETKVTLGRGVVIGRRVRAGAMVLVPKAPEPGVAGDQNVDQKADQHELMQENARPRSRSHVRPVTQPPVEAS